MPASTAAPVSPLDVPESPAEAVLKVTDTSIVVDPSLGRGASLVIRSELVQRSKLLQRAAACPCAVTRTLPMPYSAFTQWFIFVIAQLDEAALEESSTRKKTSKRREAKPVVPQAPPKANQCTLVEILKVFAVRPGASQAGLGGTPQQVSTETRVLRVRMVNRTTLAGCARS